jgi:hypothetical protein
MNEPRSESTLVVVRQRAWYGKLRPIGIHVNGRLSGEVGDSSFTAITCPPGTFEVYVGQDWCRSQSLTITLTPGGQAEVVCRFKVPKNRFAQPAKFVFLGLAVFAFLYVLVPSVKPAMTPYEPIWGPIFLTLLGLTLLALYSEMIPTLLATLSRKPGKLIDLSVREPTITDEMILQQRVKSFARTGHS